MSIGERSYAHRLVLLVFAALAPLAVHAQSARPAQEGISEARLERVSELVDRHIQAGDISGAVTLVARNGRVVHLQAHGLADLEKKTPMRKDSMFRIASMSKPVAAVAILILMEEGKLRLADPLSRFMPGFRNVQVAVSQPPAPPQMLPAPRTPPPPPHEFLVPAEREVTILDVLTHTSGIMSGPESNAAGAKLLRNVRRTGLKWTDELHTVPLEFQPGSRWAYSPVAGFDLLARLVERISGQDFNTFTRERIFGPLGMRDTVFWPSAEQRQRLVGNYAKSSSGLVARSDPDRLSSDVYFSGAGGLMSTAEDYARFASMLANGGELNGVRILSPRTVELMHAAWIPDTLPGRPAGEGYGLGVRVITDPVKRITTLSKGSFGWSGVFGTHFFVDPSRKLVGVLMVQTPIPRLRGDFEDAVMQAVVE